MIKQCSWPTWQKQRADSAQIPYQTMSQKGANAMINGTGGAYGDPRQSPH